MRIRAVLLSAALVSLGGLPANAAPASLPDALGLGGQEQLVARDAITDPDGSRHLRYDRTYGGLRVLGGDLVVHQDRTGRIRSVDRASSARLDLPLQPRIAAEPGAQLVVYAVNQHPVLAWEKVLSGMAADQTPSVLHVFTDANSGKELLRYDEIEHAEGTGNTEYSGAVPLTTTTSGNIFQLKDASRGNQQVNNLNHGTSGNGTLFTDADNTWGDTTPTHVQTAAADAAFGAAQTWDYYKNVHGRNGIRDDGTGALSRVHYGNNYVNAFWQDSCFCMTYGDGSGNTHPLTSLDVAGHEMSHGVTSATARLIYSGESGGLNEATSDIFGTAVEFNANNSVDVGDYLIGEKIDIRGDGKPLRYMDQPSKDGRSADYWSPDVGSLDVHYSSGVANHFFYLLAEGSGAKTINAVSYDSPTYDGSPVTGIGRAKAEKIWYRALTTTFTSTTNYATARLGTLAAAADLYGVNSPEYQGVAAAWTAVNVR